MMTEINDRKVNPLENSYTNYLLSKGIDKIGKKSDRRSWRGHYSC